uniref:Uncharacterized protein n=1 Tax=Knipowitschia caucasica TaxID=637954 RepID=A0AAV2LRT1_KNICA
MLLQLSTQASVLAAINGGTVTGLRKSAVCKSSLELRQDSPISQWLGEPQVLGAEAVSSGQAPACCGLIPLTGGDLSCTARIHL